MKLTLEILTPEGEILRDEIDELIAPTLNGEIGILPNHVPLVAQIMPGELRIKKAGKTSSYAITGGYIEVSNNTATILGEYAVRADSIEIAKAEEAKKKAEARMKEKVSKEDFAEIEAQLRRSILELKVGRKYKPSRN